MQGAMTDLAPWVGLFTFVVYIHMFLPDSSYPRGYARSTGPDLAARLTAKCHFVVSGAKKDLAALEGMQGQEQEVAKPSRNHLTCVTHP